MTTLGSILGSLMTSLIEARKTADEYTAILAENYKENPLLEGLSIPRVRIPDLTIDMPFIVEKSFKDEITKFDGHEKVAEEVGKDFQKNMIKNNIKVSHDLSNKFTANLKNKLKNVKIENSTLKESNNRLIQESIKETLNENNIKISQEQFKNVSRALLKKGSEVTIVDRKNLYNILTNIKTSDIKDKASNTNVVRLKITLKEEGLEWITDTRNDGSTINRLEPE